MKTLLLVAMALLVSGAVASDGSSEVVPKKVVRRISIKHASPQLILLLLKGRTTPLTPPEPPKGG